MKHLVANWFLLSLGIVLFVGFTFAGRLEWLAEAPQLSSWIVAATMFLMSWPLRFGDLRANVRRPWPALTGCLVNVGLFPLATWPFALVLGSDLGPGLIVLAATPCTLASATVWTRRAGGNDVVSMMVTWITNGLCFIITPFWIYALTGNELQHALLWGIVIKLLLTVVLPLAAAQGSRAIPAVAQWSSKKKQLLSFFAQIGLLGIVLIGSVQSGLKMSHQEQHWQVVEFLGLLAILIGLHCAAWWFGFWVAFRFGFSKQDAIAISFSGSQKTLMVGVLAALELNLNVLPLVAYHAIQLIIDSVIADWIRRSAQELPAD